MSDSTVPNPASREELLHLAGLVQDAVREADDASTLDVSATQLRVVAVLAERGSLSTSGTAVATGLSVSAMSRVADRLVAAGLLTREPASENRREVLLVLTRRGRQAARRWDEAVYESLSRRLGDAGVAARGRGASTTTPESAIGRTPVDAVLGTVVEQVTAASADVALDALIESVVEAAGAARGVLLVLTADGRWLTPAAKWPITSEQDAIETDAEPVDRSAAGEALRTQTLVREHTDGHVIVHAPVTSPARQVGVLSIGFLGLDAEAHVDLVSTLARLTGAVLPGIGGADRSLAMASRAHPWSVAAEIQARQLPGDRLRAHGVHLSGRIEPAFDGRTDAYDFEYVDTVDEGPVIDVAIVDCGTESRDTPMVTGLALGALRQARGQGLDLAGQARLTGQALWGHYRGQVSTAALLLRMSFDPWRVQVVTTAGPTLYRQNEHGLTRLDHELTDLLGGTEDGSPTAADIAVERGDRLVVLGDGFDAAADDSTFDARRRTEQLLPRLRDASPEEVTRMIMVDLLDRWGPDGAPEDATIVCIDT